jgi:hypothetical protein
MKKLFTLFLVGLFVSTTFLPVFAVDDGIVKQGVEVRKEDLEKLKQERLEKKKSVLEKLREDRCTRVSERIEKRVGVYNSNKEKQATRYSNLIKRLSVLITKLKGFGLNVSKLEADKVQLESLIKNFNDTYAKFVTEMSGANKIACGEEGNADEFKNNVELSKGYLKEVREASKAIHSFVKDTLKKDFEDLKTQANELKLNRK